MILSDGPIDKIRLRKLKTVFDISRNDDLIAAAAYSLSQKLLAEKDAALFSNSTPL
jgi:hypothetical protein